MSKTLIYLADLTHTNYIIASNVMPLGIGLVASHLLEARKQQDDIEIELFKYPSDLATRLEKTTPRIVGFANYSWNLQLSYEFAKKIKSRQPSTIVVFGGPNYGLEDEEVRAFWSKYPAIDFYIVLEGEVAFTNLVNQLIDEEFNVVATKSREQDLFNCHYAQGNNIVKTKIADRIEDLDKTPSPYLNGFMDKFFDNQLIPLTHTTRGCPFTCTFCSEGSKYYQRVAQRIDLEMELRYIAERRGTVPDLALSDANFGMFVQDKQKAETIRNIRKEYGWPNRLIVSTGKNQKERILEVASTLDGALSVAASLQSTNEVVLKNIKRANISTDALRTVVEGAKSADSPTYTEIILGLPGDTVATHKQSIRDVTNLGLGVVRMYQLILLPQTELNTPDTRHKYQMVTKFRINPRSFGRYELFGEQLITTETEEIVVATNSMSFQDYLDCRSFDLSVEIVHNTSFFYELSSLFRQLGLSWFELIERFNVRASLDKASPLYEIYSEYRSENVNGLFDTPEAVKEHVVRNIESFLSDLEGTNEIAKAKAKAVAHHFNLIHEIVFTEARRFISNSATEGAAEILTYLDDLEQYSLAKKLDFLSFEPREIGSLRFDFADLEKAGFNEKPQTFRRTTPRQYVLRHSEEQQTLISGYLAQYDASTIDGLGRILMRANPKRLFRGIAQTEDREQISSIHNAVQSSNIARVNAYGGFTVE